MINFNFANIDLFMSYGMPMGRTNDVTVFNSEAASSLQEYDKLVRSKEVCDKYIKQMQEETFIPVDVITQLYQTRERYDTDLLKIKQELIAQVSKEALDSFDREIFQALSQQAQEDLTDVMQADAVFKRAMEMKAEQLASAEVTPSTSTTAETTNEPISASSKRFSTTAVPTAVATPTTTAPQQEITATPNAETELE